MKSHISATIDKELIRELDRIRKRERRSFSNVLESAVAEYIEKRSGEEQIVTSGGTFEGAFSRRETYAKTQR